VYDDGVGVRGGAGVEMRRAGTGRVAVRRIRERRKEGGRNRTR